MANPENARLLADEKSATQVEAGLLAQEQALAARAEAVHGPELKRVQALLTRVVTLESGELKIPDLAKARTVLEACLSPDPALATGERTSALAARRAASVARDAAVRALTQALSQLESARAAQGRDVDAIEAFLATVERASSQRIEKAAAEKAAAEKALADKLAVEKAANERAAAEKASAEKAAAEKAAAERAVAEKAAADRLAAEKAATERAAAAGNGPRKPAVDAPAARPVAPTVAARPAAVAASAARAPAKNKKVSRRRRVRLAPPPKKLDVEVAVYGDNTFYTGFDRRIGSGGLFVTSLETLPAGHELDLAIDLEGKTIKTRGRVEFTRADNTANPDCTPGAGIRLLNLPSDSTAAIESFFQRRTPLFVVTHPQ